jgi:hypothetical protein
MQQRRGRAAVSGGASKAAAAARAYDGASAGAGRHAARWLGTAEENGEDGAAVEKVRAR